MINEGMLRGNDEFYRGFTSPFAGSPLMPSLGPLGMLAAPFIQNIAGQAGLDILGFTQQNAYDRIEQMRLSQQQGALMQSLAQQDKGNIRKVGQAAWTGLLGQKWTPGVEQAFSAAYDNFGAQGIAIGSMMAPDAVSAIGGREGFKSAFAYHSFYATARMRDPVTGKMGMSPESAEAFTGGLLRELYDRPGQSWHEGPRMGAHEVGSLMRTMALRGNITAGGGIGVRDRDTAEGVRDTIREMSGGVDPTADRLGGVAQAAAALGPFGAALAPIVGGASAAHRQATKDKAAKYKDMSAEDISKLSGEALDELEKIPEVRDKMRTTNLKKTADKLRDWSQAVKGMKEIFGDSGITNAPMGDLVDTLDSLTGGGTRRMDIKEAGMLARTNYNAARNAGLTIGQTKRVYDEYAAQAEAMGMNQAFGQEAATAATIGMKGFQETGVGSVHAWGLGTREQIGMIEGRQRLRAAASEDTNRLGALSRMQKEGLVRFKEDSDVSRLLKAARAGETEYVGADGKKHATSGMSLAEVRRLVHAGAESPVDDRTITSIVGQRSTNAEYSAQDGLSRVVHDAQSKEYHRDATAIIGGSARRVLGLTSKTLQARLGNAAATSLEGMTAAELGDNNKRLDAQQAAMKKELEAAAKGTGPEAAEARRLLAAGQRTDAGLRLAAGESWGELNTYAEATGFGSAINASVTIGSDAMRKERAKQAKENFKRTQMQELMSGVAHNTPIAGAITNLVEQAGGMGGIGNVIGGIFGGVSRGATAAAHAVLDAARPEEAARRSMKEIGASVMGWLGGSKPEAPKPKPEDGAAVGGAVKPGGQAGGAGQTVSYSVGKLLIQRNDEATLHLTT